MGLRQEIAAYLFLATSGAVDKDVVPWPDVSVSVSQPAVEVHLISKLRLLSSHICVCDGVLERLQELMPVPAGLFGALSPTSMQ